MVTCWAGELPMESWLKDRYTADILFSETRQVSPTVFLPPSILNLAQTANDSGILNPTELDQQRKTPKTLVNRRAVVDLAWSRSIRNR